MHTKSFLTRLKGKFMIRLATLDKEMLLTTIIIMREVRLIMRIFLTSLVDSIKTGKIWEDFRTFSRNFLGVGSIQSRQKIKEEIFNQVL